MNFWNESSTAVKVLLVIGVLVVIGLLVLIFLNLAGNAAEDPPTDAVPTFTVTPAPGETPVATQLPAGPAIVANTAVNVRLGPSTDYPEVGALQAGETAPVVGRSEDGAWYAITYASEYGEQGWVAGENVTTVDVDSVPVIAPPPLPGETVTPTPEGSVPEAPTAVIEAPADGQVGIAVTFSAAQSTGSTNLTQYAWSFGDGTVADAVVVEKIYEAAGVYLVNLAVVDADGQEAVAQHQIAIAPAPDDSVPDAPVPEEGESIEVPDSLIAVSVDGTPVTVTVVGGIPSFESAAGQTVTLDATAALELYPTLQVVWDMGDGTASVAGISVAHVYAAGGNYQIVIDATDGQRSETKLWQINVTQ